MVSRTRCRIATDTTPPTCRWDTRLSQVFHTPSPPVFAKLPYWFIGNTKEKCCDKLLKRKEVRVKLICRLEESTLWLCSHMVPKYNSYWALDV